MIIKLCEYFQIILTGQEVVSNFDPVFAMRWGDGQI